MILEFGAKNFNCFNEWVSISFRLNNQCPEKISQGQQCGRMIGIKGANSSGKTNILKTLSFLNYFCTNSFNEKPEKEIAIDSFFQNTKPIDIYIEFNIKDIEYKYEISLTKEKILRETLFRKIKRESKIIERINNKLVFYNKEYDELNIIKLRDNASIFSVANQYQIKSLNKYYLFFFTINTNVSMFGFENSDSDDHRGLSKFYSENEKYFDFTKKLIKKYDKDISDINILSRENENGDTVFFPIFEYSMVGKQYLTFYEQSSGTKALYQQLLKYYFVLIHGGLLVLDEFDIYLHPDILPDLLSLFMDDEINKKNAQIIFTTHNTSVLDYLGKYRSYLVNKENCESYAYRLDEIPGDILRNDRKISPVYESGKIGGIPKF